MERLNRNINYRPAAEADLGEVKEMIRHENLDDGREKEYLDEILGKRTILVAEENASIVGAIVIQYEDGKEWSAINYVVIAPTHQGRGIGSELLGLAENLLTQENKSKVDIILKSEPNQRPDERLSSFYERKGYVPVWGHLGTLVYKKLR